MSDALERAHALVGVRRYDDAARVLSQHLAGHPADGNALALLSLVLADLGRFDRAIATAQEAVALEPDGPMELRALAAVLWLGDRAAEALQPALAAVALEPWLAPGHTLAARILADLRQMQPAWNAANEGVRLAPLDPHTHEAVAYVAQAAGWDAHARAAITNALALDPQSVTALHALGNQHISKGQLLPAAKTFLSGIRSEPSHTVSATAITIVCWQLLIKAAVLLAASVVAPLGVLRSEDKAETMAFLDSVSPIVLAAVSVWFLIAVLRLPKPVRRVLRRAVLATRHGLIYQACLTALVIIWCVMPAASLPQLRAVALGLGLSCLGAFLSAYRGRGRAAAQDQAP